MGIAITHGGPDAWMEQCTERKSPVEIGDERTPEHSIFSPLPVLPW